MTDEFKDNLEYAMEVIAIEHGKRAHIVLFSDFTGSIVTYIEEKETLVGEFNSLEDLFEMTKEMEKNQNG
jgi:hypothetical protein